MSTTNRTAPTTPEAIIADRNRREALAVAAAKKAGNYPKATRAMAAYGFRADVDGHLVDYWQEPGAYGVVSAP